VCIVPETLRIMTENKGAGIKSESGGRVELLQTMVAG
jgi:hypothetical protein